MNYPKTIFTEPDKDNLANYLCYLAKQISCGFYQDRRFLVLPHIVERESRVIYFPDLPYSKKFWNSFKNLKQSTFIFNFDKKITDTVKDCFVATLPCLAGRQARNDIEPQWREKEREFWQIAYDFFPNLPIDKINKVEVSSVPFGSVGSFFFEKTNNGFDFMIKVRSDFGPAQIAESILTLLMRTSDKNLGLADWHKTEATVDFLLSQTKLAKLFNNQYVPTVSNLPEISKNYVAESEAYLEKLGFPIKPINLKIKFTAAEKRIYEGLLANKGKVLTYEQIGDLFWQEEAVEKYSLYSIAKIMEKIRKKIKDQGVYQELIYTIRGQGYLMYS